MKNDFCRNLAWYLHDFAAEELPEQSRKFPGISENVGFLKDLFFKWFVFYTETFTNRNLRFATFVL